MKIMGLLGLFWVMAVSTFAGTGEGSLSASVDTRDYTLTVVSEVGSPFPGVGTHVYSWGASVGLLSSGSRLAEGSNAVFECSGWTGGGLVPSLGSQGKLNGFTFEGTTSSTLTWNWELSDDVFVKSVSSDLVDAGSHVMFLEGVPVSQTFHADVEWNGKTPGQIRFVREHTLLQYSSSPDCSVNLADFAEGEKLHVYAMSADREFSEKVFVNFSVIPRPFGLAPTAVSPLIQNEKLSYGISGITLFSSTEGVETVHAEIEGDAEEKKPFPLFDGKPCTYDSFDEVDFIIDPNGVGRVSDVEFGGFGVKMGGFEVGLEIEEDVHISYDSSEKEWLYTGESEAVVLVDFPGIEIVTPFEGLLELEVGISVEVGERREYTDWDSVHGWEFEGSLLAGAGGKFTAGLGEDDVAGLFVWLKLMANMELAFANDPVLQYVGLEFSCGDKEVLGPWIWEHVWYSHEFPIKDNRGLSEPLALAEAMSVVQMPEPGNLDYSKFTLLPRSTPARSVSNDDGSLLSELGVGDFVGVLNISDPSSVFPQSNVFQYVQTAFDASVSNACYLWNVDDAARSSENRTVLKFSFDDGAAWSSPATVWEDGTGDYNPSVQVLDDGSAFAVWANGKSALPKGAGVSNMLEELEIGFGKYSPGSGWSCTNLTDNAVLDQSPRVAVAEDGSAWVVWIRNDANHYQGASNAPNTLLARPFDGEQWGAEQVLATNLNLVASSSLIAFDSNAVFTCSLHDDGQVFSLDDTEIYQAVCSAGTWGELSRMTSNSVRDCSVQLKTDAAGQPLAAWVHDDELWFSQYADLSAPVTVLSLTNEPMAVYFELLCGAPDQVGMVWSSGSGDGQDAFMINYDPILSVWSSPIQLTFNDKAERAFKGNYDEADGTLNLAFVQSEILNPTNAAPEYGATDVCLVEFNTGVDLTVTDFSYDADALIPGSNVTLSALIVNAGLSGATNVSFAFYDGNPAAGGLLIGQTNLVELLAGSFLSFEQSWTVPQDGVAHQIYIAADYAQSVDDQNRANNTVGLDVLSADVKFGALQISSLSNQTYQFEFSLENEGYSDSTNSWMVRFYDASEAMIHQMQSSAGIAAESNMTSSASWADDSNAWTNATETLNAHLLIGSDTSVVDQISAQFDTALDSDFDWISDADELRFGTDPKVLDTDGDGLDDRFELLQFESSALLADTDGDGYGDYQEYIAGTSSTNASSLFTIDLQGGLLSVPTMTNRTYAVEYADTLGDEWQSLTNFSGTGGTINVQRSSETNSRFYRVNVQF